jgi:hypothetical protein
LKNSGTSVAKSDANEKWFRRWVDLDRAGFPPRLAGIEPPID